VNYTFLRLAGTLQNQPLGVFAGFEIGPIAADPNPEPFFRQVDATVELDRIQVKRFEDARAGNDAYFQITFSSLVWYPREFRFDAPPSSGLIDVRVPKSYWIENVLSRWNLSDIKLVEIHFPKGATGENFRASYARLEEAEKLFASGHYKQVLSNLRLSFEGLANSFGFGAPGKDFFESLFASAHPEKQEKLRDALTGIYRLLHLGPHEQLASGGSVPEPVITRQDARFALIVVHAIYEYITLEG
jgi:hypothetical protein